MPGHELEHATRDTDIARQRVGRYAGDHFVGEFDDTVRAWA